MLLWCSRLPETPTLGYEFSDVLSILLNDIPITVYAKQTLGLFLFFFSSFFCELERWEVIHTSWLLYFPSTFCTIINCCSLLDPAAPFLGCSDTNPIFQRNEKNDSLFFFFLNSGKSRIITGLKSVINK